MAIPAAVALLSTGCLSLGSPLAQPATSGARPATPTTTAAPAPSRPTYGSGAPELASYTAALTAGDQQLAVAWRYSSYGGTPKWTHLDLYRVDNGSAVIVASDIIGTTVEPDDYTIPVPAGTWIVRATPQNDAGFGTGINSTPVVVGNACASADVCVRATTGSSLRPVSLVAQGLAVGGVKDVASTRALNLKQWRTAGWGEDPAMRNLGVSRTQMISTLWQEATAWGNGGFPRTPWSDWTAWQSFVANTVRDAAAHGALPDYWDVWNEPTQVFSPADLPTVTVDRWLQAYEVAWRAIKSVSPTAKIIAPSLSALQWAPGSPWEFDLDTFLGFSAAHGLQWDAVAWHENLIRPSPGDLLSSITNVDRHIAMAKAVLARHPGTVVNNAILINEYGASETHTLPGWNVGFFRALEDGGVSEANRSCWGPDECNTQLDGLVDGTGAPTAAWWTHKAYADLAQGARVGVTSTSSWQVDGLATRDDPNRTVRMLIGRHWSCNQHVNPWCANGTSVAPASMAVTIDWPYGSSPVHVSVDRLPAGTGALAAPLPVASSVMTPAGGTLTVMVPAVSDGDAISIAARG